MSTGDELPMSKLCGFAGIVLLALPLLAFAVFLTSLLPGVMEEWNTEREDVLLMGSYAFLSWLLGGIALFAGWTLMRSPSTTFHLWLIKSLTSAATIVIGLLMTGMIVAEGGLGVVLIPPFVLFFAMTFELSGLPTVSASSQNPRLV